MQIPPPPPRLLLLLLLLPVMCCGVDITSYQGNSFSHIEIYQDEGVEFLVLAQKNELINLRWDFREKFVTKTGQKNDSAICLPHQVRQGLPRCRVRPMDNHVRAMAVAAGHLYICMSYLRGSCARVRLGRGRLVIDFSPMEEKLERSTRAILCRDLNAEIYLTVAEKYTGTTTSVPNGLYLSMPVCDDRHLDSAVESVISIVNLETQKPFEIGDFTSFISEIVPEQSLRRKELLTFHYSFKYEYKGITFIYFLLTAKVMPSLERWQLRIARVSAADRMLSGYVEVLLNCTHPDLHGTDFSFVGETATLAKVGTHLAKSLQIPTDESVLFLTARTESGKASTSEAVYVVTMSEVNSRLDRIVADCERGDAMLGPTYIRGACSCSPQSQGSKLRLQPRCPVGASGSGNGWYGIFSAHAHRQLTLHFLVSVTGAANVTALAAQPLRNGATVLYAGTSAGRLLRYHLLSSKGHWLFDNSSVGSETTPVLAIRAGSERLYTLTANEVASHEYAQCEHKYKSCDSCLMSNDPYCVWVNEDPGGCKRWRKPSDLASHVNSVSRCVQVQSIRNKNICVDTDVKQSFVGIVTQNAPSVNFHCFYISDDGLPAFGGRSKPAESTPYHEGTISIRCPVSIADLRQFLNGNSSRKLKLLLSSNRFTADHYFLSVSVLVYSCRLHSNCSSCLSSHASCSWCSLSSMCVQSGGAGCSNSTSVISESSKCPTVSPLDPSALLLPSGSETTLQYSLEGFKPFMQSFTCSLRCSGGTQSEYAAALDSSRRRLLCHTKPLRYNGSQPTERCDLSFRWSNGIVSGQLDSNASQLMMYKCQQMAASCDRCTLTTERLFGCLWCSDIGKCSHACTGRRVSHGELCLRPSVQSVLPRKLTPYGNVLLRVSGTNLGVNAATVQATLLAGELRFRCELLPETYRLGRQFTCRVADKRIRLPGNETRLAVTLQANGSGSLPSGGVHSADLSALSAALPLRVPLLSALSASTVQQTGRANVSLSGRDLDAGSSLEVQLLSDKFASSLARVLKRHADRIEMQLSEFVQPGTYFVAMDIQAAHLRRYRNLSLVVVPDAVPAVSERRMALVPSGGLSFRVAVKRLNAVQRASLTFTELPALLRRVTVRCVGGATVGVHHLECSSPQLPLLSHHRRAARSAEAGFALMTNFSVTLSLDSRRHPYGHVQLLPQPFLLPLAGSVVQLPPDTPPGRQLRLRGRHLLPALRPADVRVTVGPVNCTQLTLQSLSDGFDLITCSHMVKPSWVGRPSPVTVVIGNQRYAVGSVRFRAQFNWAYAYAGAGACIALLLALLLALAVHLHRRSRRHEKSQRMEVQINLLEAQVSQNCRDAFAELQLNSSGDKRIEECFMPMPLRGFAEFACHSCFADRFRDRHHTQDPIFADVCPSGVISDSAELRKALGELHSLLLNEEFLLAMITAMEARCDDFKHQDRNHFGSLLSALMYDDIGYFTVVLTKLVQALIAKKKEANDNYKVVFRRCDSVAERLLPNWLGFLMYEQLSSRVAEPLYHLYCDIKLQIFKGPVDQITEDSKYTINEQKLLKKEINFKELTLIFEDREWIFSEGQQEPLRFEVTVLDCDSVLQAKEKVMDAVYCRQQVPYSHREQARSFQLAQTHSASDSSERHLLLAEVEEAGPGDSVRRLRQLNSYSLCDASDVVIFLKRRKEFSDGSGHRTMPRCTPSFPEIAGSLPSANSSRSLQDTKQISASSSRLRSAEPRYCHLLPPYNSGQSAARGKRKRKGRRLSDRSDSQQIVSEVFYPVLLRTKRLLTDRIADLFVALFPVQRMEQSQTELEKVPLCIKYLFDVLDDIVHDRRLGRDVAHVWKANALMLRFYTQNLQNLHCLLDVDTPGPVKYCMSTVSTLFMEACSVEKPSTPDKSSPAQKLLFVNEITDFHPRVESYFRTVSRGRREPVSDVLAKFQQQVKLRDCHPFNNDALLLELFHCFVRKYHIDIVAQLERRPTQIATPLVKNVETVARIISSCPVSYSNSHTLCSTNSSKPFAQASGNPYDN